MIDIENASTGDLQAARDLLVKSKAEMEFKKWIKNELAADANGGRVETGSEQACGVCLLGAVFGACNLQVKDPTDVHTYLAKYKILDLAQEIMGMVTYQTHRNKMQTFGRAYFRTSWVPVYNDAICQTKKEALRVFDLAIEWIDGKIGAVMPVVTIPEIQKVEVAGKKTKQLTKMVVNG